MGIYFLNHLVAIITRRWGCPFWGVIFHAVGGVIPGRLWGHRWGGWALFIVTVGTMGIYRSLIVYAADASEVWSGACWQRLAGIGVVAALQPGAPIQLVYPTIASGLAFCV